MSFFSSDSSNKVSQKEIENLKVICENGDFFSNYMNIQKDYQQKAVDMMDFNYSMTNFFQDSAKVRKTIISRLFKPEEKNVLFQPFIYYDKEIKYISKKIHMGDYLKRYLMDITLENKFTFISKTNKQFWDNQAFKLEDLKTQTAEFTNRFKSKDTLKENDLDLISKVEIDTGKLDELFKNWKNETVKAVVKMFNTRIENLVELLERTIIDSEFNQEKQFFDFNGNVDMMNVYTALLLVDMINPRNYLMKRVNNSLMDSHNGLKYYKKEDFRLI